jgi:flagellar basal-body rod modification protein FlgD
MSLNGTNGSSITPTSTPTTGTGLGNIPSTKTTDPLLNKNAFLQLMMVQMKNQDPLNPQDPSAYLGQLAQLTSVEQQTNIAQSALQSAQAQNTGTALQLLGHTVSYLDPQGNSVTGLVQKVDFTTSGPALTINGVGGISPAAVNQVS